MSKNFLINVVGPTGIGKTKWAITIAQHFKTEILSSDSRQFYREMSIGTAVPSTDELTLVPHHFVQHISIFDPYSVGDFERHALALLTKKFYHTNTMVMVGGSGLYSNAVTLGLDDFPKIDPSIRGKLMQQLESEGIESLQSKLVQWDPEYATTVDMRNPHRIIRALEVHLGTGRPYSSFLGKEKVKRPFSIVSVGITADRETIYRRIEKRVDLMMAQGLLEEAEQLYPNRGLNALQTVGYRELFNYFNGQWELDFAISEIKKNTRRFAKRQLTWFAKNPDIVWFEYNSPANEIINHLENKLQWA
ncbi:MAG: tRNA (adenosine(37)-N6)-dimethylallyltransferase MiaA [Bacteroidota bacterium]